MKPLGSLLSINQLTTEQIESILALARRMDPKRPSQILRGKRVVLLVLRIVDPNAYFF